MLIYPGQSFTEGPMVNQGFPGGSVVKNPPANAGDLSLIPGQEDPLQEEMETHFSILACSVPGVPKSWTQLSTHAKA